MVKLKGWKELPIGAILEESGTAREYKTGTWRSFRPILDKDKCINCLICWIYCPDNAIKTEDGKIAGIDYEYCKGCGICSEVCPPKIGAIRMEKEVK